MSKEEILLWLSILGQFALVLVAAAVMLNGVNYCYRHWICGEKIKNPERDCKHPYIASFIATAYFLQSLFWSFKFFLQLVLEVTKR